MRKVILGVVIAVLAAVTMVPTSSAGAASGTPAPPAKVGLRPTGPVTMDLGMAGNVLFVPDTAPAVKQDIHYTWGWVTGTAYLNKAESRSLRTYSYAVIVAAGLCAAFGWESAGAACLVSGAMTAQWQYVAGNAVSAGACVKIRVPTMWAYQYTGGDCR